jgi:hypothetical protein
MKNLFLIFAFLIQVLNTSAQCDVIRLRSQSDVDSFNLKYGHCSSFGTIDINDIWGPIYNLDSLYTLKKVKRVRLAAFKDLESISGLNNLEVVTEWFIFAQSRHFPPLEKLDTVCQITHFFNHVGDLSVYQNLKHIDLGITLHNDGFLTGLSPFTCSGTFNITIQHNHTPNNLANITPLNAEYIERLFFVDVRHISTLGLEGIKISAIDFVTFTNVDLTPISEVKGTKALILRNFNFEDSKIPNFHYMDTLEILRMANVRQFHQIDQVLGNLKSIKSFLSIVGNPDLKNISLLDTFKIPTEQITTNPDIYRVFSRINVYNNPMLEECTSPFICRALETYPDSVHLGTNGGN